MSTFVEIFWLRGSCLLSDSSSDFDTAEVHLEWFPGLKASFPVCLEVSFALSAIASWKLDSCLNTLSPSELGTTDTRLELPSELWDCFLSWVIEILICSFAIVFEEFEMFSVCSSSKVDAAERCLWLPPDPETSFLCWRLSSWIPFGDVTAFLTLSAPPNIPSRAFWYINRDPWSWFCAFFLPHSVLASLEWPLLSAFDAGFELTALQASSLI